jgi:VanZ family protein
MRRGAPAVAGRWLGLWGPVVAFLGLSFSLSSVPGESLSLPFSDLLAHFLEFGALGLLLARAFHGGLSRRLLPGRAAGALLAAVVWGVLDEFHQSFVPGRTPDVRDLLADAVGALTACLLFPLASRAIEKILGLAGRRSPAGAPVVTFLTRSGCHLCQDARAVVERVAAEFDARVDVVDVDSREDLARTYGDSVPVVLVDGLKAFKLRVTESALRRRLERHRRGVTP